METGTGTPQLKNNSEHLISGKHQTHHLITAIFYHHLSISIPILEAKPVFASVAPT